MSVVFARPDVSELVFHVYNRTVHPELFRIVKQNEIHLHHLRATVRICEAGHVICVEHGNDFVTEVSAALPGGCEVSETRRSNLPPA